jgi:propionate CoA-transferase
MRAPAQPLTADRAVALIPDNATVAVSGFVGAGHPELLTAALEAHFLATGSPRGLTLVYCAGQGDRDRRGLNHFAHQTLLRRVIGGHWNLAPKLGAMALANEIEAYNLPQGILCVLLREIAAGRAGTFTKVGLNTFVDPLHTGGKLNARTTEDLVERVQLDGETWLRYRPFPVHVALLRATRADRRGNLSVEDEGLVGEILPMAQAARNHGGLVIAQVEEIVDCIEDPKAVRVPGILVDCLVESRGDLHDQTFAEPFNPDYVRSGDPPEPAPMGFCHRRLIAHRALREIRPGEIVNLGIGLPEGVAPLAAEYGRLRDFTLTVESGPVGGLPAGGLSFGCSARPEAIIDQPAQFDFYDGGGLDIAILGAVEVDACGSVNVASIGNRFAGVGGFVNIAQNARRVVFCLTLTAGEIAVSAEAGQLRILSEGRHPKFVPELRHVCFHGPSALQRGQQVLYITERAVFELVAGGLSLVEIAPGIDLERNVLARMGFRPAVSPSLRPLVLGDSLAHPPPRPAVAAALHPPFRAVT